MAGKPGQGIGNQNAAGNRGGGRKSAYREQIDAEFWARMFLEPVSRSEMEKKLLSGEASPKEIILAKMIAGNDGLLRDLMKKLIPDSIHFSASVNQKQMEVLENNVRDILDVAGQIGKKQSSASGTPSDLTKAINTAEKAVARKGKPKVKKKKVVKKKKIVKKKATLKRKKK